MTQETKLRYVNIIITKMITKIFYISTQCCNFNFQADEDPNLVPQMGDNTTFTFNPQGPPGADGAGGAGAAVGGASEAAASAGGPILGDAAPFQF